MAENVEIRGRISVDAGGATKSTQDYIDSLKAAKKALREAKEGTAEYKQAQEQVSKSTKELDQALSNQGGSFGKLKQTLGSVVPGFEGASQGAAGLGKQLWLLVANPIVAIVAGLVVVLTVLYKAFASTNEGADKIDQVMAGLGATIEVLRDRVLAVAKAIGQFFSGDFKGALETGRKAVSGIGQEIADEFSAAAQATKTLQDLEDAMRNISVNRARLNRDLAQAKEIMNNSDATFTERQAALAKVREAEKKQTADELKAAETKYKALKQDVDRTRHTSDEKLDALADAEAAYYDLQASSASQNRALNRMDNQLRREEQAKQDAWAKERNAKIKEERERREKEEKERLAKAQADRVEKSNKEKELLDQESLAIKSINEADSEDKKKKQEEEDEISRKDQERASWQIQMRNTAYDQQKALKEKEKQDEQDLLNFKVSIYSQQLAALQMLGNTIQQFAGKSKAAMATGIIIEKAAAIGQILIAGFQANAKSVAASPMTLGQPFVGIQNVMTGLQIAGTVGAAASALNKLGKSDSSGGGMTPSIPSISAPLRPQQASTTLNQASIQGIGNAASGGVSRSFVLDVDIANNRERAERINRAARLG